MTSNEIRKSFIDFFSKKHQHTFVPSSPVVPLDDPTLLFTNAGMNQFKPYFLGSEKAPWSRVVNTQKCIRAGGKHNDLDDVGRSRRHHTFFEMLGNWSFGDYFKEGAIKMAWELLVHIWKLDPTRIHVSCYEGDEKNGVPRDTEAADIWYKFIGVPKDHIHWGGKDNFWEMGETGPCGPCTEIFYDRTPDKSGGTSVLSGEDPRVMEIWNNVFIQYNRNPDRSLSKLPAQHVDTGMGFERICQVLQGKNDNYAIDLFEPIFDRISSLAGMKYGGLFPESDLGDRANESPELKRDIAFRVIADHARMATFAITDGAKPDNKGRDSVVRSVIRRAVRFGYQQFGLRKPFLNELVSVIADAMGETFPELRKDPKRVSKIIESEETSFLATIERGFGLFEEAIERAGSITGETPVPPRKIIDPKSSFDLHTTYGFPIDLQEQMALERGVTVDRAGYEKLFEEFQQKSGEGRKKHVTVAVDLGVFDETDDSPKYAGRETTGKILGWITNDQPVTSGKLSGGTGVPPVVGSKSQNPDFDAAHRLTGGTPVPPEPVPPEMVALLLDKTNFYAEQGGQIGDVGHIETPTGKFLVADTERRGKHVLHWGRVENGSIEVGQSAKVVVDQRRADIMRNHTATHLMNHAMRKVLGDHVEQRGSLVDSEKLRFDFSHDKALSTDEIEKIERIVNEAITQNIGVKAETIALEQAKKIKGVRAVFGEKYPDPVRVICVSEKRIDELDATESSVEFCGGTHVTRTGEIGFFKITSEESLSKGVRRITAVTGVASSNYVRHLESITKQIAQNLSTTIEEAPRRIEALQAEIKQLKKKLSSGGSGLPAPAAKSDELLKGALDASGAKVVIARIDGATSDYLMSLMDSIRKQAPSHALMLAGIEDEKINFLSAVSDDLIKKGLKAGDWIRDVAKLTGGGGGGRPNMAQAGGKDVAKLDEALALAKGTAVGVVGS